MTKNITKKVIVGLIFSLAVLFGCSDESTTPTVTSNELGLGSGVSPDESYSSDQIFPLIDTTNFYGEINIGKGLVEQKTSDNQIYSKTSTGCRVKFWENAHKFANLTFDDSLCIPISGVSINETQLNQNGKYYVYGDSGVPAYFGSQPNHISILPNQYIPAFDTNITLLPEIKFTSLRAGDTIYSNRKTTLKWDGRSNGYADLKIFYLEHGIAQNILIPIANGFIQDDGQFIINSGDLSKYNEGEYMFQITRYETIYPKLDNGREIAILGNSTHIIFVHLKH
ncbi:MAG: hypothetical protein ABFD00_00760 [Chloroherpetonaceae bacterium]